MQQNAEAEGVRNGRSSVSDLVRCVGRDCTRSECQCETSNKLKEKLTGIAESSLDRTFQVENSRSRTSLFSTSAKSAITEC